MSGRDEGPLEWLLEQTGGSYMSDLRCGMRRPGMTKRVCRALKETPHGAWTGAQWTDAAGYLTDTRRTFETQGEAMQWLKDFLDKT